MTTLSYDQALYALQVLNAQGTLRLEVADYEARIV